MKLTVKTVNQIMGLRVAEKHTIHAGNGSLVHVAVVMEALQPMSQQKNTVVKAVHLVMVNLCMGLSL